jgi:hypothetical protein
MLVWLLSKKRVQLKKQYSKGENMGFLSDLPLLVVGIAVAAFLIKLFVSLRVVGKAPVWQEFGDEEPRTLNTDQPAAGVHPVENLTAR